MATFEIAGTDRTSQLRSALKKWEHDFALQNDGRKPSQEDIRKNSKIASRYREYHKLRSSASQEVLPRGRGRRSKHGQSVDDLHPNPGSTESSVVNGSRRNRHTPSKFSKFVDTDIIKATPQKNGKVLGIFDSSDCLHLSPLFRESPRQNMQQNGRTGPASTPSSRKRAITSTPSKSSNSRNCIGHREVYSTPSKTSKMADAGINMQDEDLTFGAAKSSPYHLDFDTPQALRHRRSLPTASADSPGTPCLVNMLPRQPRLKGLTSILEDLRKAEDETFADEEEALRDIDIEHDKRNDCLALNDPDNTVSDEVHEKDNFPTTSIDVPCKQHKDVEFSTDGDQNQSKGLLPISATKVPWKKKGLKRQTKRSILRPIPAVIENQATNSTNNSQSKKRRIKAVPNYQKLKLKQNTSGVTKKLIRGRGFRRS